MPAATLSHPTPALGRISRRLTVAVATAAIAAIAATPASAATRTATSPVTGMHATLSGTQLTVTPGERFSRTFLNTVQGRSVTVACVTGGEDLVRIVGEESQVPTSDFDVAVLGGPAPWPAGSQSLDYTFARDVSERVDGCLVAREPAAASTFAFNELARGVLREGLTEQRLLLAHRAAQQIARTRVDRRFPHARALAGTIAASEPQLAVAFSRDLRRARRNDVVYVIGRGTNFKRVRLAHRQDDGQPVELIGRRRGDAEITPPGTSEELLRRPGDDVGRRRP